MFWIYMIRCSDDSFYVGHTDNFEKRIAQHRQGSIVTCYTFRRRPVVLVFAQDFPTREEALAMERRVKGWRRVKKFALCRGDWAEISRLGKRRHASGDLVQLDSGPSMNSGRTEEEQDR
jgi:putative endonuclease